MAVMATSDLPRRARGRPLGAVAVMATGGQPRRVRGRPLGAVAAMAPGNLPCRAQGVFGRPSEKFLANNNNKKQKQKPIISLPALPTKAEEKRRIVLGPVSEDLF